MIFEIISPTFINGSSNPSIQDDIWISANSDNSGVTNMKYVFDIYNENEELLMRSKVYPNPTDGRGYLNVGNIIRNEVIFDWFTVNPNQNIGIFITEPKMRYAFTIDAGEDVSGVTTTNLFSSSINAYNFTQKVFDRFPFEGTHGEPNNAIWMKMNNWLTNRPKVLRAGIKDDIFIPLRYQYTYEGDLASLYFTVNFFDANGTQIATGTSGAYPNLGWNPETYYQGFVQLNLSVSRLQEQIDDTIIDSVNCEPNGVSYIEVFPNISTVGDLIQPEPVEKLRIYLDCCPRYETVNLHFMNQYGMFDTARFGLVNKLVSDTERKSFNKNDFQFANNYVNYYRQDSNVLLGNGFYSRVYNESKVNYGSKTSWKYKLTMDYPTDAEYEWLQELIVSPVIYAQIGQDYYPVTITNTNYEYFRQEYAGLRAFEVEIEINQTRYGFRR